MIATTTDGRLFAVRPHADPRFTTAWVAKAVRRAKIRGTYEVKPGACLELIRKEGTRVVSNFRVEL